MIVVTPEQIRQQGHHIMQVSQDLHNALAQVHQHVVQLSQIWEGAAKTGYLQLYDTTHHALKEMPNIVHALGVSAVRASETFQETDAELSQRLRVR